MITVTAQRIRGRLSHVIKLKFLAEARNQLVMRAVVSVNDNLEEFIADCNRCQVSNHARMYQHASTLSEPSLNGAEIQLNE